MSVGGHFVLNGALQLEQGVALTFWSAPSVNWSCSHASVFAQQAPGGPWCHVDGSSRYAVVCLMGDRRRARRERGGTCL